MVNKNESKAHYKPLLAWMGSKRRLASTLAKYLPNHYHRYFELFCGSSALGLYLAPDEMFLNDDNAELINLYQVVRNPVQFKTFKFEMEQHQILDSKPYFVQLRALDRRPVFQKLSPEVRAARFLYLVQASFSNLYRVNQKGYCNSPYGHGRNLNVFKPAFLDTVQYLQKHHITFTCGDYQMQLDKLQAGDLVYLDPPYVPFTITSNFTSYTKNGFNLAAQKQLVKVVDDLSNRGVLVMLSNSNTPLVNQLYQHYNIYSLDVFRSTVRKGSQYIKEVVITNY